MGSVELQNISKRFSDHAAVNNINLHVPDGQFLVLLGPSGCGKSTLLRMTAGLETPTEGDIFISGTRATRLAPRARNVAMVFQNYALYPHLTLFENIAFPLRVRGARREEVETRVRRAAAMVRIEHLLARKPRETSGGERQRTALARALVRDPAVFLFDEPLSNLDALLRHSARDELKEFHRQVNFTAIYVTHDQVEAMGLGDTIVVMQAGRIHQIGSPEDIYVRPADTFVATFIGSPRMNLVKHRGELLGFRPENFLPLAQFGGESDVFPVRFTIQRSEYLGSDRLIYGTADEIDPDSKVIARLPAGMAFGIDNGPAQFGIRARDMRSFDADTGKALATPSLWRTQ